MEQFKFLGKNKFYEVLSYLNKENNTDHKVTLVKEIDFTRILEMKDAIWRESQVKVSFNAFLIGALSRTLGEFPQGNKIVSKLFFYRFLVQLETIDVSVLVEKNIEGYEQATFAATIRGADKKSLVELSKELSQFALASGESHSRWLLFHGLVMKLPTWLSTLILGAPNWHPNLWIKHRGGASAISTPAKYGADILVAAWPWPLGLTMGFVKPRPRVVGEQVVPRPTSFVSFSFDRRILAGAPGVRFFERLCQYLESPETLTR